MCYDKDTVDKHRGKSKVAITNEVDYSIKWTRAVKNDLSKGKKYVFEKQKIVTSMYEPICKAIFVLCQRVK